MCRIFVVQIRVLGAGNSEKAGGGTQGFLEGRFSEKSCRTVVNTYFGETKKLNFYCCKMPKNKKKPLVFTSGLVDDIGLEPMTFRTSSGCSSQLS